MLLGNDGRHVWLGRNSDLPENGLAVLESQLRDDGIAGWLAIGEGDYWEAGVGSKIMEVRPLGKPGGPFEQAVTLFLERRRKLIGG